MTGFKVEKVGDKHGAEAEYKVSDSTPLPPWAPDQEFQHVGRPYPRIEGVEKVTGQARYSYDIHLPGQLVAKVLRSPHPHARIRHIDTSAAEALPGVHAVLSSANSPEIGWYDDSFVFDRTLRFVGEEVAAVAAESEEIATDALRLIEVDYELLPFVTELEAAIEPGAPKTRESGNISGDPTVYERGDIEAGLRDADVVIDRLYTTQSALHNSLEPHGCTANWVGEHLTLWDSTQSIFTVREQVATALDLPQHNVRVIKQFMGGGFGAKQIAWKQDVIAALLSKHSGRPVQLMLDREAENLAVGNRNPTRQHVRIGARRDGSLTAITAEILQGVGAHMTGGEGSDVPATYQTLYRCPNVHTKQTLVFINAGPAVAFRAPGHVEGAFALESAMDELARELHMDPVEIRQLNHADHDQQKDQPFTSPESLQLCYDRATEVFGWAQHQHPYSSGPKRRGIGFAAHDWVGGGGKPPGYAWIKINPDGTADVVTGTQDIGTGTRIGLTQIAAEELGFAMESVTLHLGDTATGPYSPVSSGSATQATIGPAIRVAADEARQKLLEVAAAFLETPTHRLTITNGHVVIDRDPTRATPVSDIMAAISPHMIMGQGARDANPEGKTIHTFGAQCIEVEIDLETGELDILRVVAAHDCGRIINQMMVDSQVIGALAQGIGFALTEERIIDHRLGHVLNANLEEYKVPTISDIPPLENARVDNPDLLANPTGAKGIGEPPLIPTAPAIANAVFDAIGVRIRDLPLTRSRILAAIASSHDIGRSEAAG